MAAAAAVCWRAVAVFVSGDVPPVCTYIVVTLGCGVVAAVVAVVVVVGLLLLICGAVCLVRGLCVCLCFECSKRLCTARVYY